MGAPPLCAWGLPPVNPLYEISAAKLALAQRRKLRHVEELAHAAVEQVVIALDRRPKRTQLDRETSDSGDQSGDGRKDRHQLLRGQKDQPLSIGKLAASAAAGLLLRDWKSVV